MSETLLLQSGYFNGNHAANSSGSKVGWMWAVKELCKGNVTDTPGSSHASLPSSPYRNAGCCSFCECTGDRVSWLLFIEEAYGTFYCSTCLSSKITQSHVTAMCCAGLMSSAEKKSTIISGLTHLCICREYGQISTKLQNVFYCSRRFFLYPLDVHPTAKMHFPESLEEGGHTEYPQH